MKKYIVAILTATVLLTACGQEEKNLSAESNTESITTEVTAEPTQAPSDDTDETAGDLATQEVTPVSEEDLPEEDPDNVVVSDLKEEIFHNGFFSASLVEFVLPEGDDEMVRVVFEFTNTTDTTYYKNDEEIPAGGTWEKIITYPRTKWAEMAGEDFWIHYDLYADGQMQDQIFKGGLNFTVSDDLQVINIGVFEE